MKFQYQEQWGFIPLIAENLKHDLRSYWSRIYNFVGLKRIPETKEDIDQLLVQQRKIIQLLGASEKLNVIVPTWPNFEKPPMSRDLIRYTPNNAVYITTIDEDPGELDIEFKSYRHLFIGDIVTSSPEFEKLLVAISKDEASGVIISPNNNKWILHPYDGGLDIISKSKDTHTKIAKEFESFLPESNL